MLIVFLLSGFPALLIAKLLGFRVRRSGVDRSTHERLQPRTSIQRQLGLTCNRDAA